jgi:hypothetical protein
LLSLLGHVLQDAQRLHLADRAVHDVRGNACDALDDLLRVVARADCVESQFDDGSPAGVDVSLVDQPLVKQID